MVIALAGRRIDQSDTETIRFPLKNIETVKQKLRELFISLKPVALVCSGACGADLLALEVAGELGIRRSMVLPFEKKKFRSSSVTDRPEDWGDLFDRIYKQVNEEEKVLVLHYPEDDDETYRKANIDILDRAGDLSEKYDTSKNVIIVIVWEGKPKDKDDTTGHFKKEGENRGFSVKEIITVNT